MQSYTVPIAETTLPRNRGSNRVGEGSGLDEVGASVSPLMRLLRFSAMGASSPLNGGGPNKQALLHSEGNWPSEFRSHGDRNLVLNSSYVVCKHLEMHERGKGPLVNQVFRQKVTKIAEAVKKGQRHLF